MARLRRLSPEEQGSASEDEFCPRSTERSGPSLSKHRSSPRKKPLARYTQCGDSDDEVVAITTLRPKSSVKSPANGKQIQLKSMRPLTASNMPPINLELSGETRRLKASSKGVRSGRLHSSEAVNRRDPTREEEFESPYSCDDDSEDSEDDLPSPRRLLSLTRKPMATTHKASQNVNGLAKDIESLTLESNSAVAQERPETPRKVLDTSLGAYQPDESEGENPTGFLRFSPSRLNDMSRIDKLPSRPVTPPLPQSPSKSRLQSPSKTKPKIPSPHLRESLDAFWDADTINHWNDQYSPQKPLRSPKKLKIPSSPDQQWPTSSPKKRRSPTKQSKAGSDRRKDFDAGKGGIAIAFLAELDNQVAGGKIGELAKSTGGVSFVWSKTLNSTAGRANWRREITKTRRPDGSMDQTHKHYASIELAEKVINDEHRLLNVIAHEFCHLCNFMISGIKDRPHGAEFKAWGRKCTAAFGHRGVEVTTKHSYEIDYKYVWQCSNGECGAEFRRHSKSIDPQRHTCGVCHSRIVQIKPVMRKNANGAVGGYAAYVKEHFANTKKGMPGASHKEVMEAIGRKYRLEKSSNTDAPSDVVNENDIEHTGSTRTADTSETVDSVARVLEFVTLDD